MTQLVILFVWSTIGLAAALVTTRGADARWGWVPIAGILGPLWVTIASEIGNDESEPVYATPSPTRRLRRPEA